MEVVLRQGERVLPGRIAALLPATVGQNAERHTHSRAGCPGSALSVLQQSLLQEHSRGRFASHNCRKTLRHLPVVHYIVDIASALCLSLYQTGMKKMNADDLSSFLYKHIISRSSENSTFMSGGERQFMADSSEVYHEEGCLYV